MAMCKSYEMINLTKDVLLDTIEQCSVAVTLLLIVVF